MLKFGSEEWYKELNKRVKFPNKFAFYYNKKDNVIQVSRIGGKASIDNTRYKDIAPTPLRFHPTETALIQVKYIITDQQYYKELLDLQRIWGTGWSE